jgi:hypothetical protein
MKKVRRAKKDLKICETFDAMQRFKKYLFILADACAPDAVENILERVLRIFHLG